MLYITANPFGRRWLAHKPGQRGTQPAVPTPPTALSAICDLFGETYRESGAPAASLPPLSEEEMKCY